MIRQLAEQNRKLSEQLEAISKRLDAATSVEKKPDAKSAGDAKAGSGGAEKDKEQAKAPAPPSPTLPGAAGGSGSGSGTLHDHHVHHKGLLDSLHTHDNYGLKSTFDSLNPKDRKSTPWYEKVSLRGYTQVRFGRGQEADEISADPYLFGDRVINGEAENFWIRRARLILYGDVSDHMYLYFQTDFANAPPGTTGPTYFAQIRDLYADLYVDKTKINRFRVGLSKIPYGWENMQSSQNRIPLDRTDAINSGAAPNERDLGVFYYWTPVEKQKLLKDLVDGGLRGSGNYGIFALGTYNGQGGSQLERNLNLYTISRVTWPWRLPSGQVVEAGLQGYTGYYVVPGSPIRPLGQGSPIIPAGTGGNKGLRDQRMAASFIWYPQPFGFQTEWNFGEGPGLNHDQTAVVVRPLQGGYAMVMYKYDTEKRGIFTPYVRYQTYRGGYRSIANAPFGNHNQWDLGLEWQIRREVELTAEYSFVEGANLLSTTVPGVVPYSDFNGNIFRLQLQFNY